MIVPTIALSLAAAACATIWGFEDYSPEGEQAPDARIDVHVSDAPSEGSVLDAGPCDPDAAFTPRNVPGISVSTWESMRSATLSPNELTIYFHGIRDGGPSQIYKATRDNLDAPFEDPRLVERLGPSTVEYFSPSISGDELLLIYTRQPDSGAPLDLFFAKRNDPKGNFTEGQALNNRMNSLTLDQNPFLLPDRSELWFSSYRTDAGPRMFRAKASGGSYDNPELVPPPDDTSTRQETPVLSADRKILFYSGKGDGGLDVNDIWEARRQATDGEFKRFRLVTELSGAALEYPSWLSPDGCRLYYHQAGGTVPARIYVGVRTPPSKAAR